MVYVQLTVLLPLSRRSDVSKNETNNQTVINSHFIIYIITITSNTDIVGLKSYV